MTATTSSNVSEEASNVESIKPAAKTVKKGRLVGALNTVGQAYRFAWRTCIGTAIAIEENTVDWAVKMAKKGEEFEGKAKTNVEKQIKVVDLRGKAKEKISSLEGIIDKGVNRSLHFMGVPTKKDINTLTHLIQDMADAINELAEETLKTPPKSKRNKAENSTRESA